MSDAIDQLTKTLRQSGQSLTKPRIIVFKALQGKEPQTMNHLVKACGDQIDRASIYRTISLFEKLGIVQRLQIGWKYKLELSDDFHQHHHHLTCLNCGKVTSLHENTSLEAELQELADKHNFKMTGHQLEIQGKCSSCS